MKLSETNVINFYGIPHEAEREFKKWKKDMLESGKDVEIIDISQGHAENHADEVTMRLSISVIYTTNS